jgi:hypothetical protein
MTDFEDNSDRPSGAPSARREGWFWRTDAPHDVKLAIEKATGMLFHREPADSDALVFRGVQGMIPPSMHSCLCLQAVEPSRSLYSLKMLATYIYPIGALELVPRPRRSRTIRPFIVRRWKQRWPTSRN